MLLENHDAWQPYLACLAQDAVVAELDPLGADSFFANRFHELNGIMDPELTLREFLPFIPRARALRQLSWHEAAAATRDLGMVASSLVRWGKLDVGPIEAALVDLSRTTGEVPADSVYSYGPRNPKGSRIRTFTNTREEADFVNAFRSGMQKLFHAVACLDIAQDFKPDAPILPELLAFSAECLSGMTDAIVTVRRRVSPEFFTGVLRPYFDPKVIGGRKYLAAGGAQMPVIILDLLLWGIECPEAQYIRYWGENMEYQPPLLRNRIRKILDNGSFVEKASSRSRESLSSEEAGRLKKAAEEACKLIAVIESFRYPHLRIAEANMRIRAEGSVGSGGYDTVILKFLISRGREAAAGLKKISSSCEVQRG